ncbi:hypothetical protein CDAR_555701 [Caerostris darwini]|uniref:Uncharacterized protein n=1 Tax=Caerostris darwini TaxID=1538125 RepID=A0AAV4QYR4_9ARAC|nr:hypothetical protein CDAR_555701 [Caerostris darwini]
MDATFRSTSNQPAHPLSSIVFDSVLSFFDIWDHPSSAWRWRMMDCWAIIHSESLAIAPQLSPYGINASAQDAPYSIPTTLRVDERWMLRFRSTSNQSIPTPSFSDCVRFGSFFSDHPSSA